MYTLPRIYYTYARTYIRTYVYGRKFDLSWYDVCRDPRRVHSLGSPRVPDRGVGLTYRYQPAALIEWGPNDFTNATARLRKTRAKFIVIVWKDQDGRMP